jgi:hypothetical protein
MFAVDDIDDTAPPVPTAPNSSARRGSRASSALGYLRGPAGIIVAL